MSAFYNCSDAAPTDMSVIDRMESLGVKFTFTTLLFAKFNEHKHLKYLDEGNENAGLTHIVNRHGKEFKKIALHTASEIWHAIAKCLRLSKPLFFHQSREHKAKREQREKRGQFEYYDYDDNFCLCLLVASNGYIVTGWPCPRKQVSELIEQEQYEYYMRQHHPRVMY